MTTDSEAWELLLDELKRHGHVIHAAMAVRDAVVRERERQKRGDFGAPGPRCVRCGAEYALAGHCSKRQEGCQGGRGESPGHSSGPSRLDAAEANFLQRQLDECERTRDAAIRERDEQRARAEAAEKRVAGVSRDRDEWRSGAMGWMAKHDAQMSHARTSETAARTAEARADASFRSKVVAESLLKEALGQLHGVYRLASEASFASVERVLSKARAAGYAVEGETP